MFSLQSCRISNARNALRYAHVYALYWCGLTRLAKWYVRRHGAIVLTLHRVLSEHERERSGSLPGMVIGEAAFAALLEYLTKRCEIIPLATDPAVKRRARSRVPVAITFDDGWQDTFTTALPLMQRYKAPFTVFVCSGLAGRTRPFWPERVASLWFAAQAEGNGSSAIAALLPGAKRGLNAVVECLKRFDPARRDALLARFETAASNSGVHAQADTADTSMDWESVCCLARAGVSIGSHTSSHRILTRIPQGEVAEELTASRRLLQEKLKTCCDLFSYPNGDWSEEVKVSVARAGYRLGFTTKPGIWTSQADTLLIPRINISEAAVAGPSGRFSRAMCEYRLFWTAAWAHFRAPAGRHQAGKP